MTSVLSPISAAFWSPSFWLLGDVSWSNLTSTPTMRLPEASDVAWVPVAAVVFLVLRRLVESSLAEPLALSLGVPPRRSKPVKNFKDNPVLEKLFRSFDRSNDVISALSSKTDLSPRQIQSWLRKRQKFEDFGKKPQTIDKFKESGWRFFFYFFIFIYGVVILSDKPWTIVTKQCYVGWPAQPLLPSIKWYYLMEAGFYASLTFSQFTDVKRKDFWQMFIHHIVTLCLMFGSWVTNVVRMGSMVLVVHDAVDWLLESTKMAAYAKLGLLSHILVAIFALVWFLTRLVIFPLHIIRSCMFESLETFMEQGIEGQVGGIFFLLIGCLLILYVLHWMWFYKIVLLAVKVIRGSEVKDTRSDSEESDEEDD